MGSEIEHNFSAVPPSADIPIQSCTIRDVAGCRRASADEKRAVKQEFRNRPRFGSGPVQFSCPPLDRPVFSSRRRAEAVPRHVRGKANRYRLPARSSNAYSVSFRMNRQAASVFFYDTNLFGVPSRTRREGAQFQLSDGPTRSRNSRCCSSSKFCSAHARIKKNRTPSSVSPVRSITPSTIIRASGFRSKKACQCSLRFTE
jgi:hypothetical protein